MRGPGVPGLSGEQTLRLLIVRQLTGWTYAELAFHLADSMTYRAFCRVSALVATPSKSALAATLRRVSAAHARHAERPAGDECGRRAPSSRRAPCAWMRPWSRWRSIRRRIRVSCSMRCACSTACSGTRSRRGLHRVSPAPEAREAARDGDSASRAAEAARRRACYRELLHLTEATATYATCALAHLECLPATARGIACARTSPRSCRASRR